MGRGPTSSSILGVVFFAACGCTTEKDDAEPEMGGMGGASPGAPSARLVTPPVELESTEYPWELPAGFPRPWEPSDNPTTVEKVTLGRHLFYDRRLSGNGTQSCGDCHRQELAFTDGLTVSVGSTGELTPRSSMSLANVGYASTLTWGNPLMVYLERQASVPLFGDNPVEMGLKDQADIPKLLGEEPIYSKLFEEAFPDASEWMTLSQVAQALSAFQRTLISGRSAFDRWVQEGDETALSESAKRGFELFSSERLECFHCHSGTHFTDHFHDAEKPFFEAPFHNTGLYNLDGEGSYPEPNLGVYGVSRDPRHMGQHKAPTLRNIAVTGPYMHDGSIASLEEVLDHYAAGGRTIDEGEYAGVGAESPYTAIRPFEISDEERADVVAFLESLTDEEFLTNPDHSNPWEE